VETSEHTLKNKAQGSIAHGEHASYTTECCKSGARCTEIGYITNPRPDTAMQVLSVAFRNNDKLFLDVKIAEDSDWFAWVARGSVALYIRQSIHDYEIECKSWPL